MKSTQKPAIADNDDVLRLLRAARTRTDQVRLFCLVRFGAHPENLRRWKPDENIILTETEGIIRYRRAKNARPMRFFIPLEQAGAIHETARRNGLKITNQRYEQICREAQERSGIDYPLTVSPWTLRHTHVLNELRKHLRAHAGGTLPGDTLYLVSISAGCTVDTVARHYLTLQDWLSTRGPSVAEPLDLSDFRFMEYD